MVNILIAGATGYLGGYIAQELKRQRHHTRVLVRSVLRFEASGIEADEIVYAEITDKTTLQGGGNGVDAVISSVGITRQRDGLTYMDVDYRANLNLLEEAVRAGVKKFVYVSVLNGERLRHLKICEAKERFVDALKGSGVDYCVIRPNGFFSDMTEFYTMATRGRVYLFGDGRYRSNPIHGADLAKVCVEALGRGDGEMDVGGPETLTQKEIAQVAFDAAGKPHRITYVPDWGRRFVLATARLCLSKARFGPLEFFMHVMAMDMVAPEYGEHTVANFFQGLKKTG